MNRTRLYRTGAGRICWNCLKINLSLVFAGQNVGVKQVSDGIWLVSFMDYSLGCVDDGACSLEPISPSVRNSYPCHRNEVLPMAPE